MFSVKKAELHHVPMLKMIWNVCFGDSMEYINFFFNERFNSCECIIATDEGDSPIASMYLLPVSTNEYGQEKRGFYLYAIGVLPQYRGRGIYQKMQEMLFEYLLKNNMFCILCPANAKLCEYYKSLGFMENAYISEKTIKNTNIVPNMYHIAELTSEDYFNLRNSYFRNPIIWDICALEYVLKENIFVKGLNLLITDKSNNKYFLLIRPGVDCYEVIESNVTEDKHEDITNFLCKIFKCANVLWTLESKNDGNNILRGLSYNLKKDSYYLNLVLN